ncbi:MAG: CPBP family intramembrane metalloprotease [Anaerolineales bacterium]|nr:CPBP family intramembrane metalloprotease [Anaerolineales bacterium]
MGPVLGVIAALVIYVIGYVLFGTTIDNWYVTVRMSYQADPRLLELPHFVQFLVFTTPAVIFSPLGEELFFRGMFQVSLSERFGARIATGTTALAFGLVHLLHHGVTVGEAGLQLLPISGALWAVLMAGVSALLALVRVKSGAIWPAIACHIAFNIGMNYAIFYLLP